MILRVLFYLSVFVFSKQAIAINDDAIWAVSKIDSNLLINAEVITRNESRIFEVSAPGKAKYTVLNVFTVLKEDTGWDYISVHYNDDIQLRSIGITVYDAFGEEIEKYKKRDFADHSAYDGSTVQTDTRYMSLDLSRIQYPITISLSYVKSYSSIMYYPDVRPQSFKNSVEKSFYKYIVPSEMKMNYKAYATKIKPDVVENENLTSYTWSFENLETVLRESYLNKDQITLPKVGITPSLFKVENYEGSMATWSDFSKFMFILNENQSVVTPEIKSLVATLTVGLESDRDKINSIYDHVKKTMRYVSVQIGIGGWKAFDADYVHRNSFGDCKALTNYTMTLLKEAGIYAQWALIHRGDNRGYVVDPKFVTPSSFNHVVLYIPSENLWLECTSNSYPPGYIGSSNDDRYVLIVDEHDGKLMRSPQLSLVDNFTKSNVEISLVVKGLSTVKIMEETGGEDHEVVRYVTNRINQPDKEEYFINNIDLTPVKIINLKYEFDALSPIGVETGEFTVSKIGSKSGSRMFLPVDPIRPLKIKVSQDTSRVNDFSLVYNGRMESSVDYLIPDGYVLESSPFDKIDVKTKFGEYTFSLVQSEGKISINRNYKFIPGDFSANEFSDFVEFRKGFDKLVRSKFVLKKG